MEADPQLTIVFPAREGLAEVEPVLEALRPQAESIRLEVVVAGGPPAPAPAPWVRLIPSESEDLLVLRLQAIHAARGEIVAIGEDHAIPAPDWCEAVVRAHAEHPEAAAVVGALANATDGTLAGRANFLAFGAPWQQPLDSVYQRRPAPCSTITFKREALLGIAAPGELEAGVMARLHSEGRMAADRRIVVDHYQDHGILWSVANGFHNCRASYGYARAWMSPSERRRAARDAIPNVFLGMLREAAASRRARSTPARDLPVVAMITAAAALGGIVGALRGPGRSPARTA